MRLRLRAVLFSVMLLALAVPAVRLSAQQVPAAGERVVYLGGGLADDDLMQWTCAVAVADKTGVLLLDAPKFGPYNRDFLAKYRPAHVIPIGSFAEGIEDLDRRLDLKTAPALQWKRGPPEALWKSWFPRAERVVVCPAEPRRLLLHAACLAGTVEAPLFVWRGEAKDTAELRRRLTEIPATEVLAVGAAEAACRDLAEVRVVPLADEAAVTAAQRKHLLKNGPITTLVVANADDSRKGRGNMSCLAPWIAVQKRAALLLTNDAGDDTSAVVQATLKEPGLSRADILILVAGLKAIPMERRVNPIAGKDTHIEMEPLTPASTEPFAFATGRLFHEDCAGVALMLARQRLLAEARGPRRALVVSNPGGGLPLLETISRNTADELRNAGYQTRALFNKESTKEEVRRLLPEQHIFLWEGHHQTLVEHYGLPTWTEPLPASLVFLQSCLALNEPEAQPLLSRGAVGVVGSSTRTYSASGGAMSLAFLNGLLYDNQTLGGSLRQAKNFLLAYTLLKEKKLGEQALLNGASLRASWAFTLWGDPTLRLPRPDRPDDALPHVHVQVRGGAVVVSLPEKTYEHMTSDKYLVRMPPNARLAGLLVKSEVPEEGRRLVPFFFAEVLLPDAPAGKTPRLRSKLLDRNWVFCWDARRRCGYLLISSRPGEKREWRFTIDWEGDAGASD